MTAAPLTLLLVEDHTIVRQGLRAILEDEPGMQVVGEVSDGRAAVQQAAEGVDVVVMDVALPGLNGIEATRRITERAGAPRVVILSMHSDVEYVVQALRAGAAGYVRKQDADLELVAAVRTGSRDQPFLSPGLDHGLLQELMKRAPAGSDACEFEPLTPREREVIQLVAEGRPNKQIAAVLGIAMRTVEAHRANIMRKLDLTDQAGLVRYAVRKGIVPPNE